jgi:hypothetical protein
VNPVSTSVSHSSINSKISFSLTAHSFKTEALTYTATALLGSYGSGGLYFKTSTATIVIPLSTSVLTASFSSVIPTGTLECPAANGAYYSPADTVANKTTQVFQKLCNITLPHPPSADDFSSLVGFENTMDDCIDQCASANAKSAPNASCLFVHWEYDAYQRSEVGTTLCGLMHLAPFDWFVESGHIGGFRSDRGVKK